MLQFLIYIPMPTSRKDEDSTGKQAILFIKKNKQLLIDVFAGDDVCSPQKNSISIFMAGSPGAGKTEFSKNLIEKSNLKVVRIDADEIRELIPQYTGRNSDQVQGASALGVEKLYDYVLKAKKNCILDGTFANFDIACKNVERSLKKGRIVSIFYVYQNPKTAWEFTKVREKLEGRPVPKKIFINAFFNSKDNVDRIKELYGERVKIFLVEKDFKDKFYKIYFDVDKIDSYIKIPYNKTSLSKIL